MRSKPTYIKRKQTMKKAGNGRGFTLIELLVVVLIIGILAAVAVPQYQKAVEKSRFAEAFANLKTIAQAQHACSLSKGERCSLEELDIEIGTPTPPGHRDGNETQNFWYYQTDIEGEALASAEYRKAGVCLCYLETGEVVLTQDWEAGDQADCHNQGPVTKDYAQLLNITDVSEDRTCQCC